MTTAKYLTTDHNTPDQTTIKWFDVDGETYGLSDHNGDVTIVDCDGCPVNTGDAKNVYLPNILHVEDMLRERNY